MHNRVQFLDIPTYATSLLQCSLNGRRSPQPVSIDQSGLLKQTLSELHGFGVRWSAARYGSNVEVLSYLVVVLLPQPDRKETTGFVFPSHLLHHFS